jgi:hypothetical protein
MKTKALSFLIATSLIAASVRAFDPMEASSEITAVSSKVFNNYKRVMLPDGSFRPESYGFAVGGQLSQSPLMTNGGSFPPTSDASVDDISFASIARIIEGPLAAQKYMPTGEPRNADLIILVFWGRTTGTNAFTGSEISNPSGADRDKTDAQNAKLLGFDTERVFDQGFDDPSNMMSNIRKQIYSGTIDAIEDDRYFVILRAFDFQAAWKQRKASLLWETRFSLSERKHDFGKDLPRMAQIASQYFGQDSHGLVRKAVSEGHVDVGDVKSLGPVPEAPSKP